MLTPDPDALAVEYRRELGSWVNSFCRRYRLPHHIRDEYAALAVVSLVVAARRYDPARFPDAGSYLRMAVWYDLLDRLRTHARRHRWRPGQPQDGFYLPTFDLRLDLGRALNAMTSADRELLAAQFLADVKQADLAVRYGITHGGLSKRVTAALARMREYLERATPS